MTSRIGLVGCGNWGSHILRDLVSLGAEVHVVALSEANRAAALKQGAATAVGRIEQVGTVDGYVVATPTATHAEVIEALIPTGRPIFVEKPMTSDVDEARRLASIAGERIFVMDKWRYHPGVEAMAAMAKSGELGRILAIRSFRLGWSNPHADVDAAWVLLPHDLAIAYEILGFLPAARAAWALFDGHPAADLVGVLADGEGPQVTIEVGSSHPVNRRSVLVIGSRRSVQLGGSYDDRLLIADNGSQQPTAFRERPIANDMPLLRELRAFLGHLQGGPPPRSSAAEGLLVVERIAALRRLAGFAD